MRHGSLFSGIGGFDLAADWMGWDNVFHCEWNEFGQKVLKHYWPNAISYHDITKSDFTIHRETIDILTGGFPCQPYSQSGKRHGKEDDRHLWPEMLRAIREISPRWVVGENVRGLTNWSGGLVFDEVQSDLEAEGYEVLPFLLPACAVNAPHRRDRIWFIAKNTHCNGRIQREPDQEGTEVREQRDTCPRDSHRICEQKDARTYTHATIARREKREQTGGWKDTTQDRTGGELRTERHGSDRDVADTNGIIGRERWMHEAEPETAKQHSGPRDARLEWTTYWQNFPTVSPLRGKYDGVPVWVVRYIKPEIYAQISERYTDKDLQEVWEAFQSEIIREQIGRLYKIYEPGILLQIVQLCSPSCEVKKGESVFSEETSEKLLRKLRKYGSFANSPQGRELEKQFREQFADSLPYLSHEVALVAMEVERRTTSAYSKWCKESIKGYGNAIVPQVALEIFKAIVAS